MRSALGTSVRAFAILLTIAALAAAAFFYSPDPLSGRARTRVSAVLQEYLDGVSARADAARSTTFDRLFLLALYKGMVWVGWFVYPEASAVLDHYLFGDGTDLYLDASYIRRSPVVLRAIEGRSTGTIGPISLKIREDPRLAYAVNPFYIDIIDGEGCTDYVLHQRMVFHRLEDRDIYTVFYLGRFSFRMLDGLAYVFEEEGGCRPYTVYARWSTCPD